MTKKLFKSDNAVFRTEKKETSVICLSKDSHYFVLTKIAAEVWALIDGKHDEEQIVAKIAKKHGKSLESVRKHVLSLLRNLKKEELIG